MYIDCTYISSDLSSTIMLQCQRGTIVKNFDCRSLYSVARLINYRQLQSDREIRENRPKRQNEKKKGRNAPIKFAVIRRAADNQRIENDSSLALRSRIDENTSR